MTHGTLALLQGDLRRAYRHNPFVFVFLPLLGWGILDGVAVLGEALGGLDWAGLTRRAKRLGWLAVRRA
jgi:hypothetical protein